MTVFASYSLFSQSVLVVLLAAVLALFAASAFKILLILKPTGTEKMNAVAQDVRRFALRFFGKEIVYLSLFWIAAACLLYLFIDTTWAGVQAGKWSEPWATGSFLLGSIVTVLCALLTIKTSALASLRVAQAARTGFTQAFRIALLSASTTGFFVVGLGILALAGLLFGLLEWGEVTLSAALEMLVSFAAGVSVTALFLRLSGGLFAKAADMSADIAGKADAQMSDDDPRNPAAIIDNAGDHAIGAATATNLLDSFILALVSAMVLGVSADLGRLGSNIAVLYPLYIVALGIVTSILGILAVRIKKGSDHVFGPLRNSTVVALVLLVTGSFFVGRAFLPSSESLSVFIALVSGILAGTIIQLITEHTLSQDSATVRKLAASAQTGAAVLILRGLFIGQASTFIPVLFLVLAVILAYINAGVFGIAMGAVGMLATLGLHILLASFAPVADTANGIAELSQLPKQVHARTDTLFAAGKAVSAVGSFSATAASAWAVLSLFFAFSKAAALTRLDIMQPITVIGLLLGAVLPFLIAAITMEAVSSTAAHLTEDLRKQFRDTKGLLLGAVPPDARRILAILSRIAIHKSLPSMLLAFVVTIVMGIVFGAMGVGGFVVGSLLSGFLLSSMMIMSGSVLDLTKRSIEAGNAGGKGSESHKASLLGDMLGDTLKDVSGPAVMNTVKLIAVTALLTGGLYSLSGVF